MHIQIMKVAAMKMAQKEVERAKEKVGKSHHYTMMKSN
jgi:hypothetical protein